MKKLNLFVVAALMGTAAQAQTYQIPNSDFESDFVLAYHADAVKFLGMVITAEKNYYEPKGWHGYATLDGGFAGSGRNGDKLISSTDAHAGKAAKITATSILGIVANGVMTTGRIYANSTSAADAENNYNFSDPEYTNSDNSNTNTSWCQAFTGKPDTMKVWVKFDAASSTQSSSYPYASVNAVIHSNARYQDPEAENYTAVKVAQAKNAQIANYGNWQQLAVPFDYSVGTATDPKNILVSFTTNAQPGGGTKDDALYIDDIEMVYNYHLKNLAISSGTLTPAFDKNVTSYSANVTYDESALTVEADGEGAVVEKSYESETGMLTITVKANDYSVSGNKSTYTIQYVTTESTTYTNPMIISVDNLPSLTESKEISMAKGSDGKYSLSLDNFYFSIAGNESPMFVGNIKLTGLEAEENDGKLLFNDNQTIQITKGNIPGLDDYWVGPALGDIPVSLSATVDGESLTCQIDITMMVGGQQQVIKVTFAPLLSLNDATAYDTATDGLYCVDMTREFKDSWNTFCCPFSLSAEEADLLFSSVATFESADDNVLSFSTTNDKSIAAGVPYLVKKSDSYNGHIYAGKDIAPITAGSVTKGNYTLTGVFEAGNVANGDYFISDGKFWQSEGITNIKPYRAYITGGAGAKALAVSINGEITAIDGINADGATTVSGDIYTLGGQLVRKNATSTEGLAKGIYLVNGKKIVIK